MLLSGLLFENIELVRDGSFSAMALCDSRLCMDTLTFIEDLKYLSFINKNPRINCVICTNEILEKMPRSVCGVCTSPSPKIDFFLLHNRLSRMLEYTRPEFETQIGNNCKISSLAHVDAKNVNIGNNVIIEEFVRIKRNTQIGNNVTIRSGAVIGGDGFEYRKADNEVFFVEHVGGVIIGNNVDIFSNTCVCKAVFPWDDTIIGDYTKIDNLIHIAHCCKIGKRNVIIAGAVLCGSIETDDDVKIGPNATIAKIHMEANSNASLGAVVTKDVGQNAVVSGNFAVDHSRLLKHIKEIAGGC